MHCGGSAVRLIALLALGGCGSSDRGPSGPDPTPTPLSGLDARPLRGDLGIADARLMAPGDPDRPVLLARNGRRDAAGMPPLGSLVVDETGISLVREWISGLTTCQ